MTEMKESLEMNSISYLAGRLIVVGAISLVSLVAALRVPRLVAVVVGLVKVAVIWLTAFAMRLDIDKLIGPEQFRDCATEEANVIGRVRNGRIDGQGCQQCKLHGGFGSDGCCDSAYRRLEANILCETNGTTAEDGEL